MNLSVKELRPKEVGISYIADGNETSAVISLYLAPTLSTTVLEIGKKYVFASRRKRPITWPGRRIQGISLAVKRKSELTLEESEKISLSESKIGNLFFHPPIKRGKLQTALPADLAGRVFVSDELHESLRYIFQAGKIPTYLRFSLEFDDGALKYGWEPDGSRMVWELENANEYSRLELTSISIDLRRWRPFRSLFVLFATALGY
jgi:hypothetical protein